MEFPRPVLNAINAPYLDALGQGFLKLQRCQACDVFVFYPRVTCPECLSTRLVWEEVGGLGSIASFAEVYKPQHPAFASEIPIHFLAIELTEGPVIFGRLSPLSEASLAIGTLMEFDAAATRERADIPMFRCR